MVFCITIMFLGVIGNIMVPIVILKTKDMRNSTNIFLTNLSIADLLVLLVCTPTVLVEVNTRPETWVLGHEMCKAVPFVELTVAHASVLTILAISFERYYAICEPLKAGYVCTKTRAMLICLAAWAVAAIFTSPILLMAEYRHAEYYDGSMAPMCVTQASNVWTITYFLMTIAAFFILPLFILIILYTIIAKNLISKDGRMVKIRPSKPELSFKARKQVVLMLGAVVLSFFICLLPFRIFTLWIIIATEESVEGFGLENFYNCLYFSRIMLYLNSAVNPILYNLMSSKFRKGFRKLCFGCLWYRRRQHAGRGRLATLNNTTTTTTTTTTTSSFNSHSVGRKGGRNSVTATAGRTVSLDDLRNSNYSPNKSVDSKTTGDWRRGCGGGGNPMMITNDSGGTEESPDQFRKIALKNAILQRQKSSLSTTASGDESDFVDSKPGVDAIGHSPIHSTSSVRVITLRQISAVSEGGGVPMMKSNKKKKLQFQYSLDEEQTHRLQRNGRNKIDCDDPQPTVPFLS